MFFLLPGALLLEGEGVPALEVVGGGGHGELKVDFAETADAGAARTIVQGESGDVTLDVGAEGEVGFGRLGSEIGEFCLEAEGIVRDEDGVPVARS